MIISMEAFDAFKKYLALKLYFKNDSYDYFKYNGSVNVQKSKFECRNDRYFFHKLSKKSDLELFLVVNLMDNPDTWIGKLFDQDCEDRFKQTKKRIESLTYTFKEDMSQFDSLDEAFVVRNGDYPKLLNMYRRGEVSPETLCILNSTVKIFDYWDSQISDTIVWPRTKSQLVKYSKFIHIDKKKFNDLLKQLF